MPCVSIIIYKISVNLIVFSSLICLVQQPEVTTVINWDMVLAFSSYYLELQSLQDICPDIDGPEKCIACPKVLCYFITDSIL